MFENIDELLLCRPYVEIWVLEVGRVITRHHYLQASIQVEETQSSD